MEQITIGIGEYYASSVPAVVYTLLGSCVAVCLFDQVNQVGGMNHFLLPGKADLKNFNNRARYGINAMELLINKMMSLGANRKNIVAKIFGGATVLPKINKMYHVGAKIVDFTRQFLMNERIKIINQDCGGHDIRKIFFYTESGNVFLKRVKNTHFKNVVEQERKWLRIMRKEVAKPGKIEIFEKNVDPDRLSRSWF